MREPREATVTDITAGRLHPLSKVIVHPLAVRITHWLNALATFIMIMSGWRIPHRLGVYNARAEDALSRCARRGRDHGSVRSCDLEARSISGADLAVRRFRSCTPDPFSRHDCDCPVPGCAYCPRPHLSKHAAGQGDRPGN